MSRQTYKPSLRICMISALISLLLHGSTAVSQEYHSANMPSRRGDTVWWENDVKEINWIAEQGAFDLVFIGDSLTEGWMGPGAQLWNQLFKPRGAVNMGISGDRTEHLLWRLKYGNLNKMRPRVVVVQIGTNNAWTSNTSHQIADGISAVVVRLRRKLSDADIILMKPFPIGRDADATRAKLMEAGRLVLQQWDDDPKVHCLDINDQLVDASGRATDAYLPDYVHLSAKGYGIWAGAIETKIMELLKR